MSSPRTEDTPATAEQPKTNTTGINLAPHFFSTSLATALAHRFRVGMNKQPNQEAFYPVFKETLMTLRAGNTGFWINWTRGTAAGTAQSLTKHELSKHLDYSPSLKLPACLVGATLAGSTINYLLEPALIRRNTVKTGSLTLPHLRNFQPYLFSAIFSRDINFSFFVYFSVYFPGTAYPLILFPTSALGAISHRFVFWEATADLDAVHTKGSTPSFKRDGGFISTLKLIVEGKTYTHPNCKVTHESPKTKAEHWENFFAIALGRNLFAWRTLYNVAFQFLYQAAYQNMPTLQNKATLFADKAFKAIASLPEEKPFPPYKPPTPK